MSPGILTRLYDDLFSNPEPAFAFGFGSRSLGGDGHDHGHDHGPKPTPYPTPVPSVGNNGTNSSVAGGGNSSLPMGSSTSTNVDAADIYPTACQVNGTFPLYCDQAVANAISPIGSSHADFDCHFMPNGIEWYHSQYEGGAPACECPSTCEGMAEEDPCAETNHDDHGHDHGHGHSGDQVCAGSKGTLSRTVVVISVVLLATSLNFKHLFV